VISKCANPHCPAVFRYLHEGKLFEFEVRTLDEGSQEPYSMNIKSSREIKYFWLCNHCASTMTVTLDANTCEVIIVPIHGRVLECSGSSRTYSESE
jgi:hypothetical protein